MTSPDCLSVIACGSATSDTSDRLGSSVIRASCLLVACRRVKPQARLPMGADEADPDGITLMWDADDMGSDPSDRFPFGC